MSKASLPPMEDKIERFLLSDSFYQGSGHANHINNLTLMINIPRSMSVNSVDLREYGDENGARYLGIQKTSMMKNSPSMKALESTLLMKSSNGLELRFHRIEEDKEEEDDPTKLTEVAKPECSSPSESSLGDSQLNGQRNHACSHTTTRDGLPHKTVGSAPSTETFKSASSELYTEKSTLNELNSVSGDSSISTVRDSVKTNEFSPKLSSTAAFFPIKDIYDANRMLINQIKVIVPPTNDSTSPSSNLLGENEEIDNNEDQEGIKDVEKAGSFRPTVLDSHKKTQEGCYKTKSMIPENIDENILELTNSADLVKVSKKTKESSVSKKPQYTRSSSTFSLNFNKNKEQPALPPKAKRSHTLSDLSKNNNSTNENNSKKRFSFRSLFKNKLKLGVSKDLPSVPKPLSSKSFSSPNIAMVENDKPQEKKKLFGFKDKQIKPRDKNSKQKFEAPSQSATEKELKQISKEYGNIMKNLDSLEDLTNGSADEDTDMLENEPDYRKFDKGRPDISMNDSSASRKINESPISETQSIKKPEIKRELSQNSVMALQGPGTPLSVESTGMTLLEDEIDISPFKVDCPSPTQKSRVASHRDILKDFGDQETNSLKSKNEQLLGEALFPKHLNPHEVESIVSLERSRSMKSIKSIKRNSFMNYDGSDENIIQFNGKTPKASSIKRSGSILKNANAIVKDTCDDQPATPSRIAQLPKGRVEDLADNNYHELIEFSDFIDVDNLDFSLSPQSAMERSPSVVEPKASGLPMSFPSFSTSSEIEEATNREYSKEEMATNESNLDGSSIQIIGETLIDQNQNMSKSEDRNTATLVSPPRSSQSTDQKQNYEGSDVEKMASEISIKGPLTPNFEVIEIMPDSPESLGHEQKTSPYLSPLVDLNGRSQFNNRPISMSFKPSKIPPSFGNKIAMQALRNSESHQSFNISFEDDPEDVGLDSEEIEVGKGFGTSDDECDDFEELSSTKSEKFFKQYDISESPELSDKPHKARGLVNFGLSKPSRELPSNNVSKSTISMLTRKFKLPANNNMETHFRAFTPPTKQGVRFSSRIILYDTYDGDEYDRHPDAATCNQLTPLLAQQIREELNSFKMDMDIHVDSRSNTHYF